MDICKGFGQLVEGEAAPPCEGHLPLFPSAPVGWEAGTDHVPFLASVTADCL